MEAVRFSLLQQDIWDWSTYEGLRNVTMSRLYYVLAKTNKGKIVLIAHGEADGTLNVDPTNLPVKPDLIACCFPSQCSKTYPDFSFALSGVDTPIYITVKLCKKYVSIKLRSE